MISLERYTALFARAELRATFLASMLGRLPIGLSGLAILLLVQASTDSFVRAGAATACYVTGLAAVAPLIGRLIDRYGPRPLLLFCGIAFPVAMVALVAAVAHGVIALTLAFAAVAGATFPPISVCVRTYFRRRLADDPLFAAAYSAESVLIEVIFIVGPALVAFFVAFMSAAAAVIFAAACALAGTAQFLRSPALRDWHIEARGPGNVFGPLSERGFPALVAIVLCFATAFGLMEIGITAYAAQTATPALAGVFLAVMSVGSAFGGLVYGSRPWHFPLSRQLATALSLMALGLGLLALRWDPWAFAAWCVLAGIAMAPGLIIQSMLAARIARPEHATEAFTWTTSALLAGVGIGLAAGGALLEVFPAQAAFGAAAVAALIAGAGARVLLRS
jgi:MFS family permease